jgi:hypothetical protein
MYVCVYIYIYIYIYNYVSALFCINNVELKKDEKVVDPFITLRMPTCVAETCWRLLCNKTTFIHPSAFVGIFNIYIYI